MKRVLLILISILISSAGTVLADESDLWDNFGDVNFYNTEKNTAVSDEQFDETVNKIKEKQKNSGLFNFNKGPKKMKGASYQESNETELIKQMTQDTPVLMIPCELVTSEGKVVPIGHYQVEFVKDENDFVKMKLYQAHYVIAEVPAVETEEDLYDEHLNYLTLDDYEGDRVKINYGSMDFNAFAIVNKK